MFQPYTFNACHSKPIQTRSFASATNTHHPTMQAAFFDAQLKELVQGVVGVTYHEDRAIAVRVIVPP